MKKHILKQNGFVYIEEYFDKIVNMILLNKIDIAKELVLELSKDDKAMFDAWLSKEAGGSYPFSVIESAYSLSEDF